VYLFSNVARRLRKYGNNILQNKKWRLIIEYITKKGDVFFIDITSKEALANARASFSTF
jgi:hypothetical protein